MAEIVIYYHLYNRKSGTMKLPNTNGGVSSPGAYVAGAESLQSETLRSDPRTDGSTLLTILSSTSLSLRAHPSESNDLSKDALGVSRSGIDVFPQDVSPQPADVVMPVVVPVVPVKRSGSASGVFSRLSKFSALVGIALVLFFYAPKALAWSESVVSSTIENFRMSDTEVQTLQSDLNTSKPINLPPFDPRLPVTNHLLIPAIGVTTDVQEATADNYEAALRKGVWRVSDFGAPNDNGEPIILAAHRFGYLAWTDSYRHKNSFYNLPKVEVGDLVEIDWNQRKYLYEVYAVSKGKEILDYSADLILYTCQTLAGEEKVFVYARLIVT